jgi:hypothetical protein
MRQHSTEVAWLPAGAPAALLIVLLGSFLTLFAQTWSVPIVTALLTGMLMGCGATVWWLADYTPRYRPHWECWKCRYDRRGTLPGSRCPECGHAAA